MAINLKNTDSIRHSGVKILVYGESGAGKTRLCATAPSPIILSAEAGLLSLGGTALPYIEIGSLEDLYEAYQWLLTTEEGASYRTVCLDSISEIAEVVLARAKKDNKDPRRAYGDLADQMAALIRSFRDLPGKNVYFSAKLDKLKDESTGAVSYAPSAPGSKVGVSLPYFFDEVFALRVEKDQDGKVWRGLQTQPDGQYIAKDRSGRLEAWEEPDLGKIIAKIEGAEDGKKND